MTPSHSQSNNLFVANLNQVSLEKLVRSKLELILKQHDEGGRVKNLYDQVLEQVERPMIELALNLQDGNRDQNCRTSWYQQKHFEKKDYVLQDKNSRLKISVKLILYLNLLGELPSSISIPSLNLNFA